MGTTERTLSRCTRDELGMSFNKRHRRQNLVAALALLDAGQPVHQVGRQLGYSNPSAFIAMFRRLTGSARAR
jgi:AraC-like DNA-binding protein